jgi:hypothetical protein
MSHFGVVFGVWRKSGLTNLALAFTDGFSKIFWCSGTWSGAPGNSCALTRHETNLSYDASFWSSRLVSARVAPGRSQGSPGGSGELRGSPELQNGGLRAPNEAASINRAENYSSPIYVGLACSGSRAFLVGQAHARRAPGAQGELPEASGKLLGRFLGTNALTSTGVNDELERDSVAG